MRPIHAELCGAEATLPSVLTEGAAAETKVGGRGAV